MIPGISVEPSAFSSVLLVEDNDAMQQRLASLVRALAPADAGIRIAGDLSQARALAAEAPCSLALVDVQLPDGDGIDLIAWLSEHTPDAVCVVVSSWADDQTIVRALSAGALGYLLKDAEDIEISLSLRSIERGGAPIDPVIARRILSLMPQPAHGMEAAPEPPPAPEQPEAEALLTHRETEILQCVARGMSNREIADLNALSRSTIETHTRNIYRKLAVHSRTAAIFKAQSSGLIPPRPIADS